MTARELNVALQQMSGMLSDAASLAFAEANDDQERMAELAEEVMNKLQEMFDANEL